MNTVRPDLKTELDHLAEASHRGERGLANEAVALYLAQQRGITAHIQEGLAQAQRGEFVSDEEIKAFFARCAEPEAEQAWIEECRRRAAAIDRREMPVFDADEVMAKYRR